jgi:hypothetical protein
MKPKLSIIIANICLVISGCDPMDKKFIINNTTPTTKSYYITQDSTTQSAIKFYSEKFYTNSENNKIIKEFDYLKPNKKTPIDVLGTWENYLDKQFKDSIAYFYVIDSSDIGKEAEFLNNNTIKQYKITSKHMKDNKWELGIR